MWERQVGHINQSNTLCIGKYSFLWWSLWGLDSMNRVCIGTALRRRRKWAKSPVLHHYWLHVAFALPRRIECCTTLDAISPACWRNHKRCSYLMQINDGKRRNQLLTFEWIWDPFMIEGCVEDRDRTRDVVQWMNILVWTQNWRTLKEDRGITH